MTDVSVTNDNIENLDKTNTNDKETKQPGETNLIHRTDEHPFSLIITQWL